MLFSLLKSVLGRKPKGDKGGSPRKPLEECSDEELIELAIDSKVRVPPFCRINRVFREIPKPNIVVGCTQGNLRQVVRAEMDKRGLSCNCIRCREIGWGVDVSGPFDLTAVEYSARHSDEQYLSYETKEGRLAGYLRLSLPRRGDTGQEPSPGIPEIQGAALVREVHVYGPALALGMEPEKWPFSTVKKRRHSPSFFGPRIPRV